MNENTLQNVRQALEVRLQGKYGLSDHDRDDLIQETLLLLTQKYASAREEELFRLAMRIVQLKALGDRTKQARHKTRLADYARLLEVNRSTTRDAAETVLQEEIRTSFYDALAQALTPEQRYLLLNCTIRGETLQTAAAKLGVSVSTAHRQLHDGLHVIQSRLAEYAEAAHLLHADRLSTEDGWA